MPPRSPNIPARRLTLLAVFGAVALALAGGMILRDASAQAPGPVDLLPDLDQRLPGDLLVKTVGPTSRPRFRLGFTSSFSNVGDGPLIITGRRSSRRARMRTEQILERSDGSRRAFKDVVAMRYAYSNDHNHFHVLRIDRYSLRDARGRLVAPDRKTGFCVGDRRWIPLPGRQHPDSRFGERTGECARGRPSALRVLEGLTPGWYDNYKAQLEGQYIDITAVRAGRYSVAHQVNADRRIRESSFANNTSSVLINISWPRGRRRAPNIALVASCLHAALCTAPGTAATTSSRRAVPVLDARQTARFTLVCSLVHPAAGLSPRAQRARAARIAESRAAYREALGAGRSS